MARVTVEDCIRKIPNRFELIMMAAQRARKIGSGAALTIDRDDDKNPVVSLREIAGETVSIDELKEELIRNNQRVLAFDDDDDGEENIELMDGEAEWGAMAEKSAGATPAAEGMYAEEDVADEDDAESMAGAEAPSLEDLAGSNS